MWKTKVRTCLCLITFSIFIVSSVYIIKDTREFIIQAADEHAVYVLIDMSLPLDNSGKRNFRDGLLDMGILSSSMPNQITHLRRSNDTQKIIMEVVMAGGINKGKIVSKLAQYMPHSVGQLTSGSDFQIFGGVNATYEESRLAAVAYLIENDADWGEAESIEEPVE